MLTGQGISLFLVVIRWEISRRFLPSRTIVSAMLPSFLGYIMICLWGFFAGRFAASSDVFKRNGRLPSAAINLVTAHDGFTFATAFASTINTMKQTEKKIATGPTTITVTIMVKKG